MEPERKIEIALLTDPRYRSGWYKRASERALSVVSSEGATVFAPDIQVRVSLSYSILKVNSTQVGNNEVLTTCKLAEIMPRNVIDVVSANHKLHSFITRGYTHAEIEVEQIPLMMQKLARIQLKSVHHLDEQRAAGCPDRSPQKLAAQLQTCTEDEFMKTHFERQFERFCRVVPKFFSLCNRQNISSIPRTLKMRRPRPLRIYGAMGRSRFSIGRGKNI